MLRHPAPLSVRLWHACYLYRRQFGKGLTPAMFMRWTGYSRSTAYRAQRVARKWVDDNGDELAGIFAELGGTVHFVPAESWEHGPGQAVVLALARRWHKHKSAEVSKDRAVRIAAPALARASGCHEKTARRRLDRLSTGKHRKTPGTQHAGRLLLKCGGGRARFVLVLSERMRVDFREQQRAAAARAAELAAKEAKASGVTTPPGEAPAAAQAVETRVQTQDDHDLAASSRGWLAAKYLDVYHARFHTGR